MNYIAQIIVKDKANISKSLQPELRTDRRSSSECFSEGKNLVIKISASDAVAMRASFNSISKLMEITDKI
jgi:tRNA threonylcarbamoyladenosine modification (KEOPS) complex  Pcc1 subunit